MRMSYLCGGNVIPDGMGIPYRMEWECHTRWNGNVIPMWYGNVIPDGMGMSYLCGIGIPYHIGMVGMESYHTVPYYSYTKP